MILSTGSSGEKRSRIESFLTKPSKILLSEALSLNSSVPKNYKEDYLDLCRIWGDEVLKSFLRTRVISQKLNLRTGNILFGFTLCLQFFSSIQQFCHVIQPHVQIRVIPLLHAFHSQIQ